MKIIFLLLSSALVVMCLAPPVQAQASPVQLEHIRETVKTSEGWSLAAFVSRPLSDGKGPPLPTLFYTQAVSCNSIAPREDRLDLRERVALATGFALIRVERAGIGESEGPGCDELDYDTEVRHYREAFDQLSSHPWVDRDRIIVIGSSLGSTTAPLVAQGKDVSGVVVQGGGALTYFERMLHFDRLQLERQSDFSPDRIGTEMRRRIEFQSLYLHQKMVPNEIAAKHPHLSDVWESLVGTDAAPHYGRPYAWHWQAAEKDWLAAWAKIDAPVMVVYGEYEQFESRHGHRVIVDTINRLRPGTATWLEIPQAGHSLRFYPDPISAYARENGERRPEAFVEPVANWLMQIAGGR